LNPSEHDIEYDPADYLLVSRNIFTATENLPFDGYVAIQGNRISSVGTRDEIHRWCNDATRIYDLGDRVVSPGFVDNHTFFTGNALSNLGVNLSTARNVSDVLEQTRAYAAKFPGDSVILGNHWTPGAWEDSKPGPEALDALFPSRPVVLFTADRDNCWLNTAALERYGFNRDTLNFEAMWKLLRECLGQRESMRAEYRKYMAMLNARGITTIKDVGYDDFYGFLPTLSEMEAAGELTLRVNFVSQPVGQPIDFDYAENARSQYHSDFLKFQGFNIMTDGTIASFKADLIEPYTNRPDLHCIRQIDYPSIEQAVLEGDRRGFKFGLHAQGDMAVRRSLDIFEKCLQQNGTRGLRHNLTDLELSHPDDLERMGQLGVVAEIYAQIITLSGEETRELSQNFVGPERATRYWNHRKMADSAVPICFATDLPLMIPDIPDSIYGVAGKLFPEGGKPFNPQNALTIAEVLKGWTLGGQFNNHSENILGTLEPGKRADIAVLDQNVFDMPIETTRNASVCMTISDGRIVFNTIDTFLSSFIKEVAEKNTIRYNTY